MKNIYSTVSIDTECDQGYQWSMIKPRRFDSVVKFIPETFQKIFIKYGVVPTYLLSPEILENDECINVLKSLAHVELGTHLHGEFINPFKNEDTPKCSDYQGMYPPELEHAKMANLTQLFQDKLGFKPRSFRAGRWGIGPHSSKILESLGYLVDSSVTPYFSWKFPKYTLNYKTAIDRPYNVHQDNFMREGDRLLLEVPVTIISNYGHFYGQWHSTMPLSAQQFFKELPLWRPLWLRPTYSNFKQMKYVIDTYIRYHQTDEDIVLNMMFHSVEILPDSNPYGFNTKRIKCFLSSMEQVFEYLKNLNVKFVGLSDVYKIFNKKSSPKLV